jgi:hypothetical protein
MLVYGSWRVTGEPERALIQAEHEARFGIPGTPAVYQKRLDVFSPDGRLTTTMTSEDSALPMVGTPMTVDREGRVYTYTEEPFPQIRRYRVVLDRNDRSVSGQGRAGGVPEQ